MSSGSLRIRTNILMSIVVFMMGAALFIITWYSIGIVRNNTLSDVSHIADLYIESLNDAVDSADKYLVGLRSSQNLYMLQTEKNDAEFYRYVSLLKKEMDAAVQTYRYLDCLFVYQSDRDLFYESRHYDVSDDDFYAMRKMLRKRVRDEKGEWDTPDVWHGVEFEGKHYFLRVIPSHNTFIGSCISADRILGLMRQGGMSDVDYLTFLNEDGADFCSVLPDALNNLEGEGKAFQKKEKAGRNLYLLVGRQMKKGDMILFAAVRDKSAIGGLATLRMLYPIVAAVAALFLLVFMLLERRWVLAPVSRICAAMEEMKNGNLDFRITDEDGGTEFKLIEDTFNEMADHIETLKIGIYEEQMSRQEAELHLQKQKYAYQKSQLQYLQLQINPHFYINCLNIINNLSISRKNELICRMTEYLGNHLRYTLEGNETEPLARELEYVRNYAHIQELRFGSSLHLNLEAEEGTESAAVPPLVIQTFVENTVKYEVVPGEETLIYIVISWEDETRSRILIEIWDDGGGYPEEVIQTLMSGQKIWRDGRERFGIRNLMNRIQLIYGERGSIRIGNHPETGGASVTISLPVSAETGESEEKKAEEPEAEAPVISDNTNKPDDSGEIR